MHIVMLKREIREIIKIFIIDNNYRQRPVISHVSSLAYCTSKCKRQQYSNYERIYNVEKEINRKTKNCEKKIIGKVIN